MGAVTQIIVRIEAPVHEIDPADDLIARKVGVTGVDAAVNHGDGVIGGAEAVRRCGIENVALLAHVDLGLEVRDLEVIITLLNHFPERHVRRVAMARHVDRGHAERIGLQLERGLAARE